jgi:hypothetical protein
VDHHAIGLDLDVEGEATGILHEFEEVPPHKHFAAAEGEEEHAGFRQLIQNAFDFGGGHLAFVVVIEITMHAALVAAIGDVDVNAERNTERHRLFVHFHEQAHFASTGPGRFS